MIKYEIKRGKKPSGNFIMAGYDFKTIKKSDLKRHLSDDWVLVRKKYFIITYLSDLWSSLNTDQKITIIGISIGALIAVIAI